MVINAGSEGGWRLADGDLAEARARFGAAAAPQEKAGQPVLGRPLDAAGDCGPSKGTFRERHIP
jgi:hypothetical protein